MENTTTNGTTTELSGTNVQPLSLWIQVPIGAFIIITNIVTLAALPLANKIQVNLRILFGNMAIADTIVGIIFIVNAVMFHNIHALTLGSCIFRFGLIYLSALVSVCNVSMMALDRCLTIKFPFKYLTWMNIKKAITVVTMSWCINFFITMLSLLGSFTNYDTCLFMKLVTIETLITPGICGFSYLLVVIVCYFFIIGEVRRHANAIHPIPAPIASQSRISVMTKTSEQTSSTISTTDGNTLQVSSRPTQRPSSSIPPRVMPPRVTPSRVMPPRVSWKYMNATKTVTTILGAYVCLNMPLIVIFLIVADYPNGRDESHENRVLTNSAFFVMVLNSVVNPIIYQLKLKEMRAAVLEVIVCKFRCRNR